MAILIIYYPDNTLIEFHSIFLNYHAIVYNFPLDSHQFMSEQTLFLELHQNLPLLLSLLTRDEIQTILLKLY